MHMVNLRNQLERTLEPESMDTPELAIVYHKMARVHAFLDRLFARKIARLGVKGRALDVGCGSGLLSLEVSRRAKGLHITAVDLSSAMLDLARGSSQQDDAGAIEFVQADAKALPFQDGTFDIVFSQHTLHHLPDPEALFLEMERVARPGGYVLLRDLRRPRRAGMLSLYLHTFGCIYNWLGKDAAAAKSLYRASLNAALSYPEWAQLAKLCQVHGAALTNVPLLSHADIVFRKRCAP